MEVYLKNTNDDTGKLITTLITQHNLRVNVQYPEKSSTFKDAFRWTASA